MTPAQKKVAREILGLPSPDKATSRNVHGFHDATLRGLVAVELVAAGWATQTRYTDGQHDYAMTPKGARLALEPGERLHHRDFPPEIGGYHPSSDF